MHFAEWRECSQLWRGLKLDDEAVIAVVARNLAWISACHISAIAVPSWTPVGYIHWSFVCKRAPSRPARHHALNDLVALSLSRNSSYKGTCRVVPDGHSSHDRASSQHVGMSLICPLSESYTNSAANDADAAAEVVGAYRKEAKCAGMA